MITMEIIHGGKGTSLSMVRACGMSKTSNMALDMYRSPYLTILYLLRSEQRGLRI